jgi:predicted Zn finger-like uncharacterized protein
MEEVRRARVLVWIRVHIMMNEDYPDPYQQETGSSIGRWLVFGLILLLGPIGVIGITMMMPLEMIPLYIVFYIPMVVFGLYATYRWAQGRSIAPTDVSEDERILDSMRRHAVPVQRTAQSGILRCPNCENSFAIENALPIDENVIKCPFCDTRLHLTE